MKIEGMKIEEFIEYFEDFILRVRDPKKYYNKSSDNENIVYYNGIKSFVIKSAKNGCVLNFPINVYKLNPTGLKNANNMLYPEQTDLEEGETREQKEAKYRVKVGNICDAMHRLFDFEMNEIDFAINFNGNKKVNKDKIIKNFYKFIINNFSQCVKRHNRDKNNLNSDHVFEITNKFNNKIINSNISREDFKNICNEFTDKVEFTLKFTPKLTTKKIEINSTPKDIIILQCWFLRYSRDIGTVSGVDFKVKSPYKYPKKYDLESFAEITKEAIENYKSTSCEKLEKTYQHLFMLKASEMKDLFKIKDGEYVDYFEQEYGIYNPKIYGSDNLKDEKARDKTGRIDCIVYKYKKGNNNERLISDIYMIELKVNCDVILGDNGVMTHLEDINAFLNFDGKSIKKYQYYDYDTLEKRINDRIEILNGGKANFKNVSKHFYTIIGYTEKKEISIIKEMLKNLTSLDGVNKMINDGVKDKSSKFKLNKRFKGTTLSKLKQDIKDCDIKFFLESNTFSGENIGLDFEDITEELF